MLTQFIPPVIGITTFGRSENYFKLREEYVDSVRRAQGVPLLLPPGEPHLEALLGRLDGIIFSGGPDIDPKHYGGVLHETLSKFDAERDQTEIELAKKLIDMAMPMLYICRGAQVLNVALGGSLIEHLPDEVGDTVAHRLPPKEPTSHPITIVPTSHVAQIMGATEIKAASWHHQAPRTVAPGLQVTAHAPDGAIEGLELPTHPWLVAVQWHPELTAANDPTQQRLFDALVEAAARYKAETAAPTLP